MYAVSQAYREAMKKPVQRHSIKGTVNGVPFTEENILAGSFSIKMILAKISFIYFAISKRINTISFLFIIMQRRYHSV